MLINKYFYCCILLFIIFIICGNGGTKSQPSVPVIAQQNNQNQTKSSDKQPDKNKDTSEALKPPAIQPITQPQHQKTEPIRNQKYEWYKTLLDHPIEWLLVLFNGLLALFSFFLWRTNIKLWIASQEQSHAMGRSIAEAARSALAMQSVADSMIVSSRSASENVEIFKDVREKQLRPWVLVDNIIINNVIDPSKSETIKIPGYKPTGAHIINAKIGPISTVYIKNSGPTPAINLKHWASICIKEYPIKSDLPGKRSDLAETKATIASQGINTIGIHWPYPFTHEQIAELKKGTMVIYVHGEITYTDIFSKNRRTIYRIMHGAMTGLLGITTGVTICEEGNEVD